MSDPSTVGSGQALQRLTAALADRYTIERELGAGGMATVYLAQDLKHDRRVAVKVLRPELAAVIGAERFLAEIKTTANLQHPHILPLFDSGAVDGTVFYVMPFVEGESLRDRMTREKQLPIDDALRIAREVADALAYAHQHGVIHRDIKPENILLHGGHALVADFGIALAASKTGGTRMTETGMSLGTPQYMSPEQAMGERELDARTDIYALGCVTYEMLTGEPPFSGPTAQAIVAKVMTEKPAGITVRRDRVPAHVEDAVLTALEKLPADRFESASAFASALNNPDFALATRGRGTAAASRAARPLAWTAVAVAIVMTAAFAYSVLRPGRVAPEAPVRFVLAQLPNEAQFENAALGISSDGRLIAYLALDGGVTRVYRRYLADVTAAAVPGTDGAMELAVSPDGRSLAFMGADERLTIVPMEGGRSRTLIKTTAPAGMGWSARHGLVLGMPGFSRDVWGLSMLPETGDTSLTILTRPKPTAMNHDPVVLSDGETVLFVSIPLDTTQFAVAGRPTFRLATGSIAAGKWATTKLPVDAIAGVADNILVYIEDGALMAVPFDLTSRQPVGQPVRVNNAPAGVREAAMAANGTLAMRVRPDQYQLALVNEQGEGGALLPDTIQYLVPRVSPDGKRAALSMPVRGSADGVWVLNLADKTRSRLGFSPATGLDWTRDGKRIVASSFRDASWQAADRSDSAKALLQFPGVPVWAVTLTPDGSAVAVVTGFKKGGYDVLLRKTSGDTATIPLVATSANEYAPRFSPDGRWLAYTSDDTGRPEVYVQPFPGPGARLAVSTAGGNQAVWGGDSRRLFYRVGNAFMAADLSATGGALAVAGRRKLFEGSYYGADATQTSATYDVMPDGHSFLVARALGSGVSEIVVWTGWLQELRAQVSRRTP